MVREEQSRDFADVGGEADSQIPRFELTDFDPVVPAVIEIDIAGGDRHEMTVRKNAHEIAITRRGGFAANRVTIWYDVIRVPWGHVRSGADAEGGGSHHAALHLSPPRMTIVRRED